MMPTRIMLQWSIEPTKRLPKSSTRNRHNMVPTAPTTELPFNRVPIGSKSCLTDFGQACKSPLFPVLIATLGSYLTYLVVDHYFAKYISQSTILVEGQTVPENMVQPVVSMDLGARMATLQQQVMSQTNLQPVVERVYPGRNSQVCASGWGLPRSSAIRPRWVLLRRRKEQSSHTASHSPDRFWRYAAHANAGPAKFSTASRLAWELQSQSKSDSC